MRVFRSDSERATVQHNHSAETRQVADFMLVHLITVDSNNPNFEHSRTSQ